VTAAHQLTWDNFRSTVFLPGEQRVHRVHNSPRIEVFGDGILNRVGIWLEVAPGTAIPPELSGLAFIATRKFTKEGIDTIEVASVAPALQRQFYHFAIAVAERVIVEHRAPVDAVALELDCFAALLEESPLLGTEQQLGLLGELLFLERLVSSRGLGALDSWIGPLGEPHDFRVHNNEFEVKTTISPRRIHTIHGLDQLTPSKDCELYVVSVVLGPPGSGSGFSLTDMVEQLSRQFAAEPARLKQFTSAVDTCGFRDADRGRYTRRFILRRPFAVVAVDEAFPAITRPSMQAALGARATRIDALRYEVNVEGLEHEDTADKFALAIHG
jgi:hypothetical protein